MVYLSVHRLCIHRPYGTSRHSRLQARAVRLGQDARKGGGKRASARGMRLHELHIQANDRGQCHACSAGVAGQALFPQAWRERVLRTEMRRRK